MSNKQIIGIIFCSIALLFGLGLLYAPQISECYMGIESKNYTQEEAEHETALFGVFCLLAGITFMLVGLFMIHPALGVASVGLLWYAESKTRIRDDDEEDDEDY